MSALRSLEAIDITQNAFEKAADAIDGLASIPALRDLSIELETEDDEVVVFDSLPDLHVLNGTSVLEEDDEDEAAAGREDAVAPASAVQSGGDEQSQREQTPRRGEDRENESLNGYAEHAAGGRQDATWDNTPAGGRQVDGGPSSQRSEEGSEGDQDRASHVADDADADAFPEAPRLRAPRPQAPLPPPGRPPAEQQSAVSEQPLAAEEPEAGAEESPEGEVSLTQDDLEDVAVLYGTVKALKGAVGAVMSDDEMAQAFDAHIQRTMQELEARLEGVEDPYLRQSHIVLAKHSLYDVCFKEAIEHAETASPDFANVLRRLRQVHSSLFDASHSVVEGVGPHYAARLAEAQAERARGEEEARELLKAAEQLEKEAAEHAEDKRRLAREHAEEMTQAQRETRRLRTELRRAQRGGGGGGSGGVGASPASRSGQFGASPAPRASPPRQQRSGPAAEEEGGAKAVTVRRLSLRQLKDYIEAIYASKVKFDAKCAEGKLPRETMEQHMYTFLNQRYGLKSIIVEQATAILKATRAFESRDNVVQVFARILAHDIDEEFHLVQEQLTETATELLRVYLKGKFPRKSEVAIQRMHEAHMKGVVEAEEWKDIVQYMYNAEDAARVIEQLHAHVQAPAPSPQRARGAPRAGPAEDARRAEEARRGAVPWDTFLKVLLDFQLAGHERYLARFRTLFRRFNPKRDGVLGEGEFRDLVVAVDPSKTEEQVEALLTKVDPYTNQRITFSDCVAALPAEIVAMSSAVGSNGNFDTYSASATERS